MTLTIDDLVVDHKKKRAVDHLSLKIYEGETVGLVGESGCGKSTLAKTIMGLHEPLSGSIYYNEIDLLNTSSKVKKNLKKEMHLVFQSASTSLNPRMTVEEIITEALYIHRVPLEPKTRALELMKLVHLSPHYLRHYPHELSGGQQQRVCIARALCLSPKFIIFDESIAALDVSVQAQITNLLIDLRDQMQLTYLFISHDLLMVKHIASRIAVMHRGKIVEMGPSDEIYHSPTHPYTQKLIASIPLPDPRQQPADQLV